ncbi:hypothetical protein Nepgr_021047 [Nepenthes gracilis]|uniref:Uncharacterized protein n=1 Tax=Nepenthes gracilis TaxID=150966 RepID=A0AAD3T064_NEPGR|nr:hypothetical protein Nepgr_021047 [Nepenthes gracilis]
MVSASGMSSGLEEPFFVLELIASAQEVTCFAPGENSTSGFGLDSKSHTADAGSATIPIAICSVAGSNAAKRNFSRLCTAPATENQPPFRKSTSAAFQHTTRMLHHSIIQSRDWPHIAISSQSSPKQQGTAMKQIESIS